MSQAHSASDAHEPHILPIKVYLGVFFSLMVLTVITVAVSYVDLGASVNIAIAMLVATVKASLVCLFFMHLKYDDRFNSIILVGAFAFLALLFVFTLADFQERGTVDPLEKGTIEVLPKQSIYDPSHGEGHGDDHGAEAGEAGAAGEAGHGAGGTAPAEGDASGAGEAGSAPADSGADDTGGH